MNHSLGNMLGRGGSLASQPTISGFAYPNETLTAPAGASYQWYVNDIDRGTASTLVLTVNDIGLVVRCVVDAVECTPVTVWHPNQISAVKHFWWAASGAYNFLGNNYTDETAPFTVTDPESKTLSRNGSLNGKAAYGNVGTPESTYCSWNSTANRWELVVFSAVFGDGQDFTYTSTDNTTYPWQVTTWAGPTITTPQVATRVATTVDTLATDGQAIVAWRDIIGGVDATSAAPNAGLFESSDLDTASIKFDTTDFFILASTQRTVFNSRNCCYIFAGVQDNNFDSGDSTHGVVSINRNSSSPKLGLVTRGGGGQLYRASASSANFDVINASAESSTAYVVLTAEALFTSGSLSLRVNSSPSTVAISTTIPNNSVTNSFIGASTSSSTTNFGGYMTVVILAAGDTPISDTDRSRIERFIGLLDSGIDIPLV